MKQKLCLLGFIGTMTLFLYSCGKQDDKSVGNHTTPSSQKYDLASLIKYESENIEFTLPPPEDGKSFPVSGDFDGMMRSAPPLDPEDPRFHEGNALFWNEQMLKIYVALFENTSKECKTLLSQELPKNAGQIENIRAYATLLEKFTPKNRADKFVKFYTMDFVAQTLRFSEALAEANSVCNQLNNNPSKEMLENSLKILRKDADTIKTMIYRQILSEKMSEKGITRDAVLLKKATWLAMRSLVSKVEIALRLPPPNESFEILPTDEALNAGRISQEVADLMRKNRKLFAASLVAIISEYEIALKYLDAIKTQAEPQTRQTVSLIVSDLRILRAAMLGDILLFDKSSGDLIIIGKKFADNFEKALSGYGVVLPGMEWELGPRFPEPVTQEQWLAAKAHPINSGRWIGAYLIGEDRVMLPGIRVVDPTRPLRDGLIWTAQTGDIAKLKLLLAMNIPVDYADERGITALMSAALNGHTDIVKLLIAKGADPNKRNAADTTPLIYAAGEGHNKIVQVLLRAGSHVNDADVYGQTALIQAATGHVETVRILLEAGADPTIRSKVGLTALDIARSRGKKEIASLLQRVNAK